MAEAFQILLVGPVDQKRALGSKGDGDVPVVPCRECRRTSRRWSSCSTRPLGFPSHERSALKESCAKYLPLNAVSRSILRRTPSGSTITFGKPPRAAPFAMGRIVGRRILPGAASPSERRHSSPRDGQARSRQGLCARNCQVDRTSSRSRSHRRKNGPPGRGNIVVTLDALYRVQETPHALIAQVAEIGDVPAGVPTAVGPSEAHQRGPVCSFEAAQTPG